MDFFETLIAIFVVFLIGYGFALNKSHTSAKPFKRNYSREGSKEPYIESRNLNETSRLTAPDGFRYDPNGEWPFDRRKIMTSTEYELFKRVRLALPEYYIFTQVQLSQIVLVRKGHSFKMWFSRISQMSVDFILADSEMNIVAAIELDDKTHYGNAERHKADSKKDKVLTAAGIRIIRWRCEIMPSSEQIRLAFPECATNHISGISSAGLESKNAQKIDI